MTIDKPYIGDVLTPQEILDHPCSLLIAGVGSGKNTFFEEQFPDKQVLIVTSMRAKKDETDASLEQRGITNVTCWTYATMAKQWIDWCAGDREHAVHLRGRDIIRRVFDYDLIVIDEAHALIVDATFADDRITLLDFLQWGVMNQSVVLSTATPEPLLSSHCLTGVDYHVIDLLDTCRNLLPKRVIITSQEDFFDRMADGQGGIQDFSYLANGRETLDDLASYLYEKYGRKSIQTYNSDQRFSGDGVVEYLFSTSCSREGLNVYNESPMTVAVETHDPLLAYQYAGRFRNGVSDLYILYDVTQNKNNLDTDENDLAMILASLHTDCVPLDNESLLALTSGFAYKSWYTDELLYNSVKKEAILRLRKINKAFKRNPRALFETYFENVVYHHNICLSASSSGKKVLKEIDRKNYIDFEKYVDGLYDENKGSDGVWCVSEEQMKELLEESKELNIRHKRTHTEFKDAPALLRQFGYTVKRCATNPTNKKYTFRKLTKKNTVYYIDGTEGVIVEQDN